MKMTKTEIENKIHNLKRNIESCKDTIENCENIIKANENEIKKLEAEKEEPTFERVGKDGTYYLVGDTRGKIVAYNTFDDCSDLHRARFDNNNYFHTEERADEVADKINFLLKLERLHDIYCPDYKPDWEDERFKWYILFERTDKQYVTNWSTRYEKCATVYFDSLETANKVCKILNKELENENM